MGDKPILFNIDEEVKTELAVILARDGDSFKDVLTELIKQYVKLHKEGNSQHVMTTFMENEDGAGFPTMGIDYNNKKNYTEKYLQKDERLNKLGKELWGHVNQWYTILEKL